MPFPRWSEVPEEYRIPIARARILIGGKILDKGFPTEKVISPCSILNANGQPEPFTLGETSRVPSELLIDALEAATQAWSKGAGQWPTAHMEERIAAVQELRNQMVKKRDLITKTLMWEIAKSWADSQAEFDRTIQYIDDTLEMAKQVDRDSSRIQAAGGILAQIRRAPLGVTLCMGPFNYPLNETFTTLIPALVMGNPVVIKLPRFGVLCWDPLLEMFRDCFPKGVVNVVNGLGREIIGPAIQTAKVDVLAFIGSSQVAAKIKQSHPRPHRFRAILSLDAKNPAVVLPDAEIDNAVDECLKGSLSFNGQRCTALKILFVHKSISKDFTEKFVSRVQALKAGMPWEKDVKITPLPERKKPAQLYEWIDEATAKGALHLNPDHKNRSVENLFFPAVLTRTPLDCHLATEEQFGPVVPIVEYKDTSEFVDYVVHSRFGMQASVFGRDSKTLGPLIDHLANQVCRINLNTQCQRGPDVFPFTGRKASAEGTLSVYDALRSFSIRSMVATKQDPAGKTVFRSIIEGDHSQFLSSKILL